MMTKQIFWSIVNKYSDIKDNDKRNEGIVKELSIYDYEDMVKFHDIIYDLEKPFYNEYKSMWDYIIDKMNNYVSDDSYEYILYNIISLGEIIYNDILNDYKKCKKYLQLKKSEHTRQYANEGFNNISARAYELRYGEDEFYERLLNEDK